MRLNAKHKKARFYTAFHKTGHVTPTINLQLNDERISQIYGKYGTGVNLGQELGFSKNVWKPAHCKLQFSMYYISMAINK